MVRLGRVSRRWGHMPSVVQLASGRLRARTPSGGSGPRTAAALRTLTREQLRVRAGVGKPPPPPGATPFFDGRAYGPPLCGGTPPATPPSKTRAPAMRHCRCYAAVAANLSCQLPTQRICLNGDRNEALVKKGNADGVNGMKAVLQQS